MKRRSQSICTLGVVLTWLSCALGDGGASIDPIEGKDGDRVMPRTISRSGEFVAGWIFNSGDYTPFVWSRERGLTTLRDPAGNPIKYGTATGVSDNGVVVGFYNAPGGNHGFSWTNDSGMIDLGDALGLDITSANAVSADGQSIAVQVHPDSGDDYAVVVQPDGRLTTLPTPDGCNAGATALAISADGSTAAGLVYDIDDNCRWPVACRWPTLSEIELCGRLNETSWARSISSDGETVVGQGWNGERTEIGFMWSKLAGIVALDTPPGSVYSDALGVSESGRRIVGYSSAGACVWEREYDAAFLADVLQDDFGLDMSDWLLTGFDVAISADGTAIAGWGSHKGRYVGWLAAVPYRRHRADMNCDGSIDFDDIDGFVIAITSRRQFEQQYPDCYFRLADVNRDDEVDFDDIDPFVDCLINGGCQ